MIKQLLFLTVLACIAMLMYLEPHGNVLHVSFVLIMSNLLLLLAVRWEGENKEV